MKNFLILLLIQLPVLLVAQNIVSGTVNSRSGESLIGANVYLPSTYEGSTVDSLGQFKFNTTAERSVLVVVQHLGYATDSMRIQIPHLQQINFRLRPTISTLSQIVITAGAMEASDTRKTAVLSSIDVVTTGAQGDLIEALSVLPGSTPAGESGQLLVRGGAASESQAFINGMRIPNLYTSNIPDVPSRSRFSPFDFKGITFATGGFSAQYGDALSAALILQTQNLPEEDRISLGIMTLGGSLGFTKRYDRQAVSLAGTYTNLGLYKNLNQQAKDRLVQAPQGGELQAGYWWEGKKGASFRAYSKMSTNLYTGKDKDLQSIYGGETLSINNKNTYSQMVYQQPVSSTSYWEAGVAYGTNADDFGVDETHKILGEKNYQTRLLYAGQWKEIAKWKTGASWERQEENLDLDITERYELFSFNRHSVAAFVEADWFINRHWLVRTGLRMDRYDKNPTQLSPRFQLSHMFTANHQLALSAGRYQQRDTPSESFAQEVADHPAQADHLMLTYFKNKNSRLLRVEAYYKWYQRLGQFDDTQQLRAHGTGYARGIDLFFRDRKSIRNGDLWISMSLIESQRKWRNTPELADVPFASPRVFSVVYKHFFPKPSMGVSLTYRWHNGRPYQNPNEAGYFQQRSPNFHDLSANISYLTNFKGHFTVLFISMTNVANFNQVHTYRYAPEADSAGHYEKLAVRSLFPRFPFVGMFMNINAKKERIGVEDL